MIGIHRRISELGIVRIAFDLNRMIRGGVIGIYRRMSELGSTRLTFDEGRVVYWKCRRGIGGPYFYRICVNKHCPPCRRMTHHVGAHGGLAGKSIGLFMVGTHSFLPAWLASIEGPEAFVGPFLSRLSP